MSPRPAARRTKRTRRPRTLLGRWYRRRPVRLALWVVLEALFTLFFVGLHRITGLALLFGIGAFVVGLWPLRPSVVDPLATRTDALATVLGWLLAPVLIVFAPLSVSTLWLDAVGTVRSGTVVDRDHHIATRRHTGTRRYRRPARTEYAVRTDDGQLFGSDLLDDSDLGNVFVGDRVQLRVDPAGIFGPQGERRRHDVLREIGVWFAVVAATGLVVLEVTVRARRRPGVPVEG